MTTTDAQLAAAPTQQIPFTDLRTQAILAITFPAATRILAALLYGISLSVPISFDGDELIVGVRGLRIPRSRFLRDNSIASSHGTLDHAFCAYAFSMGARCTVADLLRSSFAFSSLAGIGRRVRNAIAHGEGDIPHHVLRAVADDADILLLCLAGGALGAPYAPAAEAIKGIQQSCSDEGRRGEWIAMAMGALSWDVDASKTLSVVNRIYAPAHASTARERFEARMRVAAALASV